MMLDSPNGVNDNIPTNSAITDRNQASSSMTTSASSSETHHVVFLTFPQVMLLDLVGPWEVFSLANRLADSKSVRYKLTLVGADEASQIRSVSGISVVRQRSVSRVRGRIDTLVVPATSHVWAEDPPDAFTADVRRLAKRSNRVVSICGGAFFLAAAGLLDGKKATTHWSGTRDLASRYPKIDVQEDSIFVRDENIYTSAGVTAGIDLSLALVEEDLGTNVALACARQLVVFMRRPGGQSQFSSTLESQRATRDPINELVAWATDNVSSDLSVQALAERANMSLRNFSRIFRKEVGQTPATFVQKLRVDAVRRRLEESDESLSEISASCGFSSTDSMRRSFLRVVKVAPGDYRRRFHGS